ncbi:hypothetical protein [Klebsiella pneumoniae IS39]|nr:hypothetical protein [Klebsiella pneumoniae IS39]
MVLLFSINLKACGPIYNTIIIVKSGAKRAFTSFGSNLHIILSLDRLP